MLSRVLQPACAGLRGAHALRSASGARFSAPPQWPLPVQRKLWSPSVVRAQAGQEPPSSEGPSGSQAPPPPRVVSAPASSPQSSGVRVVRVEDRSAAWAGVAARDDGSDSSDDLKRTAILVGGDIASLLLFSAIGRVSHGEGLFTPELLATAGPFIAGWLLAAPFVGGFSDAARGSQVGPAAGAAAKSWAVGIPLGLVIRAIIKAQMPPTSFAAVTLGVTGVFLIGWRSALAAATPKRDTSPKARKNKQGNPLEFLTLLTGLVKRW